MWRSHRTGQGLGTDRAFRPGGMEATVVMRMTMEQGQTPANNDRGVRGHFSFEEVRLASLLDEHIQTLESEASVIDDIRAEHNESEDIVGLLDIASLLKLRAKIRRAQL